MIQRVGHKLTDDRTAVSFQQVLKVGLRRLIGRIDAIEHYRRLGHRHGTFLRPEGGYRSSDLQV